MSRRNLVLIGMPGAGKSTAGVLAAKQLAMPFVDVDVALQAREGRRLAALLAHHGYSGFCALEGRFIQEQRWHGTVIATGGSAVYSAEAMACLKESGLVVYLKAGLDELAPRLGDLEERGVVRRPGQSLEDLYAERHPLYLQYADKTLECTGKTLEEVAELLSKAYSGA